MFLFTYLTNIIIFIHILFQIKQSPLLSIYVEFINFIKTFKENFMLLVDFKFIKINNI
jgi:hypothetical protein